LTSKSPREPENTAGMDRHDGVKIIANSLLSACKSDNNDWA